MKPLRPMLSAKVEDLSQLKFPLIASPKIDGLRALSVNGQLLSRTLKKIPNLELQDRCEGLPDGLDGELCIGDPFGSGVFNRTTSACMSYDGDITKLSYLVFDLWNQPNQLGGYRSRLMNLRQTKLPDWVQIVHQLYIENVEELMAFETNCLNSGYEGVMLRHPESPYKYGRSTFREGYLIKLKRFDDAEAKIIGFQPLFANANAKEQNELGLSKRSTKQEGLVEQPMLGALEVEAKINGEMVQFNIGSGFTETERYQLWENREHLIGQEVRYKYLPYGMKDKPRHPIFLGLRYD